MNKNKSQLTLYLKKKQQKTLNNFILTRNDGVSKEQSLASLRQLRQ